MRYFQCDTLKQEDRKMAYQDVELTDEEIAKSSKDLIEELSKHPSMKVEVVGRANLNEWGGKVTPQIFIEDIEVKDNALGF